MKKYFNKIQKFFLRLPEQMSRSFAYARFGWNCPDFDDAYLYQHMEFKLKRIKYTLEHGVVDLTSEGMPEAMQALTEAIEICKRLYEDRYINSHLAKLDDTWGDYYEDLNSHSFERSKVKTKQDLEDYFIDCKKVMVMEVKERDDDLIKLGKILRKYSGCWWD